MKDSELTFDRLCHVLYSKPCKKEIRQRIVLHCPIEKRDAIMCYCDVCRDVATFREIEQIKENLILLPNTGMRRDLGETSNN